ncbi:hypothetical protein C4D60_Mb01t06490 [Musa balbisiana]|uniref:Uncharacterized protein n=1 Tax=Musa balbisiana TaxID=52838 RepID=A0A4S8JKB0_MUSBA|nr:hypothetical protein C4D60_Mb01t06490 [Musa balbisiana]
MDGGINGSQRMSRIGLRWEQGSDIGFRICISYGYCLPLLNIFSLPVDGPRGTDGKNGKEGAKLPAIPPAFQEVVVVPSLWRLLPSVFLLLLLPQVLSTPLLPTADKACHDIAGASQGGGEGLRNLPRHPLHCLSHPAALREKRESFN